MCTESATCFRLVETETLTGDEFREIVSKHCTIPLENVEAVERQV